MFPHPDRQRQATPRPEAVKGSGFALAVPPLTALAGSECGATCRSGWGGQNQDVNLHSNQPECWWTELILGIPLLGP